MRLSSTAQLLVKQFDGYLNLDAGVVATKFFGVALKTARAIPEFRTLVNSQLTINVSDLANLIDTNRNINLRDDDMNAQQILEFGLMTEHGTAVIPLEVVSDKYLNMSHKSAQAKFNTGELKRLGLNAFRLNTSQKAPILVLVTDLAEFVLTRRKITIAA